jgi:hypothetical protein
MNDMVVYDRSLPAVVHYEDMRVAVRECATIDEAREIANRMSALAFYARQRDDTELQIWAKEIQARAHMRFGELSMALEKSDQARGGRHPTGGKPTKTDALAEVGVSTTAAQRDEELAGGPTEEGQRVAQAAAEDLFAKAREEQKPVTMKGLRAGIREALTDVLGPKPERQKRAKPEASPDEQLFTDFVGAIRRIAECTDSMETLAQCAQPRLLGWHIEHCIQARAHIGQLMSAMRERMQDAA